MLACEARAACGVRMGMRTVLSRRVPWRERLGLSSNNGDRVWKLDVSTERSSMTTVLAYTCKPSMAGRTRQPQG
ncbi:hypothetical protein CBM2600_A160081 [Cupriavidus taiwanensis]|nr:hypothetical protein CBM2600_A160081 [Cupriavidus taiwanensis]